MVNFIGLVFAKRIKFGKKKKTPASKCIYMSATSSCVRYIVHYSNSVIPQNRLNIYYTAYTTRAFGRGKKKLTIIIINYRFSALRWHYIMYSLMGEAAVQRLTAALAAAVLLHHCTGCTRAHTTYIITLCVLTAVYPFGNVMITYAHRDKNRKKLSISV